MRWVFDLDGTLIDNRQAIVEAYRAVGVTEVPFSMPWQDFATKAQHEAKAKVYAEMLDRYAKPTPLYERLWSLWSLAGDRWIRPKCLTGASLRAVETMEATPLMRDLRRIFDVQTGQTPQLKANWLAVNGWGTYVDDDADARRIIQELTTWRVIEPEVAQRHLCWQPGQTRGSMGFFRLDSNRCSWLTGAPFLDTR